MLENYERKRWKKEWLLVESVHAAERASIIISEDNAALLVLAADVKLLPTILRRSEGWLPEVSATEGKLFQTLGANLHPFVILPAQGTPSSGQAEVLPVRGQGDAASRPVWPGIDVRSNPEPVRRPRAISACRRRGLRITGRRSAQPMTLPQAGRRACRQTRPT